MGTFWLRLSSTAVGFATPIVATRFWLEASLDAGHARHLDQLAQLDSLGQAQINALRGRVVALKATR